MIKASGVSDPTRLDTQELMSRSFDEDCRRCEYTHENRVKLTFSQWTTLSLKL
jgi:hypothetical protein